MGLQCPEMRWCTVSLALSVSTPYSVGTAVASSQATWAEGCQHLKGGMELIMSKPWLLDTFCVWKHHKQTFVSQKLKRGDALCVSLYSAIRRVRTSLWDASTSQRKGNISLNLMEFYQYDSTILEAGMMCWHSAFSLNVLASKGQSLTWPNAPVLHLNKKSEVAECPLPVPGHLSLLQEAQIFMGRSH